MPALAALSVPTWQSLMTQRLTLAPSRDVVALCAAATTAGVAKPAMPALISIRRVREVGSIDALLCGWPRRILNAARSRALARFLRSRLSIHRDDGAARHLVLRRRQKKNRRRHLLDLGPGGKIRLGHGLPVGRRVHDRG